MIAQTALCCMFTIVCFSVAECLMVFASKGFVPRSAGVGFPTGEIGLASTCQPLVLSLNWSQPPVVFHHYHQVTIITKPHVWHWHWGGQYGQYVHYLLPIIITIIISITIVITIATKSFTNVCLIADFPAVFCSFSSVLEQKWKSKYR